MPTKGAFALSYPDWPPELAAEFEEFRNHLTENQPRARLAGKEIDAALQDPRWRVAG